MNFVGTGKRLSAGAVGNAARAIGIETAALLAFLEIEAAGTGFDNRKRPKALRETHVFFRELGAGAKRDRAVREGLATKSWTRNYKSDSYPDIARMVSIEENAALRSVSWGLGQIMGFNCGDAGHQSARVMVLDAMKGEDEQLMQIVNLMRAWGIHRMLTGRDLTKADSWRDAAARYNGSGYATHNYHGRMATAYVKHSRGAPMELPAPNVQAPVLRLNMKGEAVRNLQSDLIDLGFDPGPPDGRFGTRTDSAVREFQASVGILVDGRVGKTTQEKIAAELSKTEPVKDIPNSSGGGGGILGFLKVIFGAIFGSSKG